MNQHKTKCECGTVERLASDPKSPIEYDKKLNEYNLVSEGGEVHYRMYFCFFCGGKLPESKRAGRSTEPSEEERKEIAELMSKVRSMRQALEVLGKPDQTVKAPKTAPQENGESAYKNHHRYLRRWKTLDLTLRERVDGSVDSAFTGKYKGESKLSSKKARNLT